MFLKKYNTLSNPHKNILTGLLLFFVYFAATFVKAPILFLKPRFWAEEGVVYFLQGRVIGLLETVTAMPLGYLSFPANIAGWVSAQLPLYYAPYGALIVSLAIQLLIPCVVIFNRYFDGHRARQAVFLLIPLLVFQSFETWLNSINSQFWMLLAASMILAAPRMAGGLPVTCFNFCVALLAGLSGPGSAFLAPLFVIRAVLEKRIKWLLFGLAVSVGAVLVLALQQNSRAISFPVDVFGVFVSFHLVFNNICMRCANVVHPLLVQHGAVRWLLAMLVAAVYTFFWRRTDENGRWLLAASMVLTALTFASMLGKDMVLGYPPFFGARYLFAPAALLFGALVSSAFRRRRLEIAILVLLALNGVSSSIFYPVAGKFGGEAWRQGVSRFHAGEGDVIYFDPGLCAFSPSAGHGGEKRFRLAKATMDSFEFDTATHSLKDQKFFLYRQSTTAHEWEAGAPDWQVTTLFMYGSWQYGFCRGGDTPAWSPDEAPANGKVVIKKSDIGPLEGYRFLIGFGDDFAAMLARKDFLIIEGAELLRAQE